MSQHHRYPSRISLQSHSALPFPQDPSVTHLVVIKHNDDYTRPGAYDNVEETLPTSVPKHVAQLINTTKLDIKHLPAANIEDLLPPTHHTATIPPLNIALSLVAPPRHIIMEAPSSQLTVESGYMIPQSDRNNNYDISGAGTTLRDVLHKICWHTVMEDVEISPTLCVQNSQSTAKDQDNNRKDGYGAEHNE